MATRLADEDERVRAADTQPARRARVADPRREHEQDAADVALSG